MKIIDLLNKISNCEEVPKKIRITDIDDGITKHYNFFYDEDDQEYKDDELFPLGARLILDRVLNDTVEIIEEEKKLPKKLDWNKNDFTYPEGNLMSEETVDMLMEIQDKVNFILDYLKSKGNE